MLLNFWENVDDLPDSSLAMTIQRSNAVENHILSSSSLPSLLDDKTLDSVSDVPYLSLDAWSCLDHSTEKDHSNQTATFIYEIQLQNQKKRKVEHHLQYEKMMRQLAEKQRTELCGHLVNDELGLRCCAFLNDARLENGVLICSGCHHRCGNGRILEMEYEYEKNNLTHLETPKKEDFTPKDFQTELCHNPLSEKRYNLQKIKNGKLFFQSYVDKYNNTCALRSSNILEPGIIELSTHIWTSLTYNGTKQKYLIQNQCIILFVSCLANHRSLDLISFIEALQLGHFFTGTPDINKAWGRTLRLLYHNKLMPFLDLHRLSLSLLQTLLEEPTFWRQKSLEYLKIFKDQGYFDDGISSLNRSKRGDRIQKYTLYRRRWVLPVLLSLYFVRVNFPHTKKSFPWSQILHTYLPKDAKGVLKTECHYLEKKYADLAPLFQKRYKKTESPNITPVTTT